MSLNTLHETSSTPLSFSFLFALFFKYDPSNASGFSCSPPTICTFYASLPQLSSLTFSPLFFFLFVCFQFFSTHRLSALSLPQDTTSPLSQLPPFSSFGLRSYKGRTRTFISPWQFLQLEPRTFSHFPPLFSPLL